MRSSPFFLPTLRENPAEAQIVSHRLMLRAGMVRQASAGIYSWLPLGFKVLKKIEQIVREEQDRAGCQEVLMPTIQSADLWRNPAATTTTARRCCASRTATSARCSTARPTRSRSPRSSATAVKSATAKLPKMLYHIQWKFRDEVRPRFGVMRGREFLMKDAYSFDMDFEGARRAYNKMFVAYLRTFARMGMQAIPMEADTGPIGGNLSHEFIILADTGESQVYCDRKFLEFDVLGQDINYGDAGCSREAWSNHFTSLYAAHRREARRRPRSRSRCRRRAALCRPRHRGRPHLLFRHQVFRAAEGPGAGQGRQARHRPHGLLRHRRVAHAGGDHRGQPRRQRHHLAGERGAVQGRPHQHQGRRQGRHRDGRGHLCQAEERRRRCAL